MFTNIKDANKIEIESEKALNYKIFNVPEQKNTYRLEYDNPDDIKQKMVLSYDNKPLHEGTIQIGSKVQFAPGTLVKASMNAPAGEKRQALKAPGVKLYTHDPAASKTSDLKLMSKVQEQVEEPKEKQVPVKEQRAPTIVMI